MLNNLYKKALVAVLVMILFLQCGCAALFGSKYQVISINSTPQGADVYVMGNFAGITPANIKIRKGSKSVIIDLVKLYYKPNRVTLYSRGSNASASSLCTLDYTLGWFLLGIPIQIDKLYSKKCYSFYKTKFDIAMLPEESLELTVPRGYTIAK